MIFNFFVITGVIGLILLIMVKSIRITGCGLSQFELDRRAKSGDKKAQKQLNRERLVKDLKSLQQIVVSLLFISVVLLTIGALGWWLGLMIAVIISVFYGAIARLSFINRLSQKLYDRLDGRLVRLIKRFPKVFKLINSVSSSEVEGSLAINSRQELQYLIDNSDEVLSSEEKSLINNSLDFSSKLVKEVMTVRSMIDYVRKNEFLGPLTLDDLHKKGRSYLPVISSDIDHIIGILSMQELLTLDVKKSTTAEKAMTKKVNYIDQNQTLKQALLSFLSNKQPLAIVINKSKQTVGLLTLSDVLGALLGDDFKNQDTGN